MTNNQRSIREIGRLYTVGDYALAEVVAKGLKPKCHRRFHKALAQDRSLSHWYRPKQKKIDHIDLVGVSDAT